MALRDINLIAPNIVLRRGIKRHLIFWTACLLGTLTLISCAYLYPFFSPSGRESFGEETSVVDVRLAERIKEIKQSQDELEILKQKQSVFESISVNCSYSRLIALLVNRMNMDIWLSQLTVDRSKDQRNEAFLNLMGFSRSNQTLGEFLTSLSMAAEFDAVELKYAVERDISDPENPQPIRFQIACTFSEDTPQ